MPAPTPQATAAPFRELARTLLRHRVRALGRRLTATIVILVVSVSLCAYWQAGLVIALTTVRHGEGAGLVRFGLIAVAGLVLSAIVTAMRARAYAGRTPGPEWLALPVSADEVESHLVREARQPALLFLPPTFAGLVGGVGLLPHAAVLATFVALVPAWLAVTHLTARIALRLGQPARAGLSGSARALVSSRRPASGRARARARFRLEPAWRALARLDARLSTRRGAPAVRLALAWSLWTMSIAMALVPGRDPRVVAFAAFLLGCTEWGAWAAWRASGDPSSTLRALPFGLGDAWRARMVSAVAIVVGLAAVQLAGAASTGSGIPTAHALGWMVPGLAIMALGLHLGLSLGGLPRAAENLHYGWLASAVVLNLVIPLLGWVLLVVALVQSTLRLRHWRDPEVA